MYQREKEQIKNLFKTSPFIIDGLRVLEDHSSKAWAKLCHVENVAKLMETAAEEEGFSEKERLIAFAAGQFHDIAYINDVMLTGKKSGPQHGARGAIITFGILTQYYQGFNEDDIKIIVTAIANHDGATPTELDGFTKKLTFLLRDCDKVDCYRRLSTESLENVFQKPLQFDGHVRQDFANGCLSGKPMKYAEMQNFNEEALLYLGWFFQLNSTSCQKAAYRFFEAFAERMFQTTTDAETKSYISEALKKARSIGKSSL